MKAGFKFIHAFAVAALCMLAFRSLAFTLLTVDGNALEPVLRRGDRVVVNRWSYGLRAGGNGSLFSYGRLWRSEVRRGDIVAFDSPSDSISGIVVCRCTALPGDTVRTAGGTVTVPGKINCDEEDCYWMESLNKANTADSRVFGFVPESLIIGRVCLILYNHDDKLPPFEGYDPDRLFLKVKR